jgi:hypothetical protein
MTCYIGITAVKFIVLQSITIPVVEYISFFFNFVAFLWAYFSVSGQLRATLTYV